VHESVSCHKNKQPPVSDACQLSRGVRKGCPLSPLLFNIYTQHLVEEALENMADGVKVKGLLVKAV